MKKVLWISHRGVHSQHVENTKLAFDAAVAAGFTCLETDLRTTLDGVIVLHHDADMRRTSGQACVIERTRYEDCQSIPLADGQHLLSLEDFMARFANQKWIFDIKPESGAKTLQVLRDWTKQEKNADWLCAQARFLLWRRDHVKLVRSYFPKAQILAGERECIRAGLACLTRLSTVGGIKAGVTYSIPPRFWGQELFAQSIIAAYHRRGARVLAYLPETEADMQLAIAAGVDEILINGTPLREP